MKLKDKKIELLKPVYKQAEKEEVLFTINYRTDLTTAHVIRYNGILYDIARIDTFEGYKEDLTLYCSRRARQN